MASSANTLRTKQRSNEYDDSFSSATTNTTHITSLFWKYYERFALLRMYDWLFFCLLLAFELFACFIIIQKVPYTEIDWKAYMEEVEMWYIDGQYDYRQIRGNTGPLVYPAGFLYLFAFIRHWTSNGTNIRMAQYVFATFYILTQIVVWSIYQQSINFARQRQQQQQHEQHIDDINHNDNDSLDRQYEKLTTSDHRRSSCRQICHRVWTWRFAMGVTCLSKRLHSIFLLRLFNDGPTMLLLYCSIYYFNKNKWNIGCVLFSLAVSIKMNVLLFAPGLLLLILQNSPNLITVIVRLLVFCALPQLILGAPFLLTFPISYLRKAFELDRVFFYIWTVNLKFLPEQIFLSKTLSIFLLALHLGFLAYYCKKWLNSTTQACTSGRCIFLNKPLSAQYITTTLFVSNFIGIVFARSIHYQFYCWYFHTIPYLLWYNELNVNNLASLVVNIFVLLMIETAYLTFPATSISSIMLQVAHFVVLYQIKPPRTIFADQYSNENSKTLTTTKSKQH